MRLLIAAGGTGGHIYPALAVARSLGTTPEAPELRWLGGHRGLEATSSRRPRIPLRRLAARSLRTTEADVHAVLDPIRLGASVPQATAILRPGTAGGDLHDRRLRRGPGPPGGGPARHPGRALGRQRDPGPRGPRDRPAGGRAGRLLRRDLPGAGGRGARAGRAT